MPKLCNFENCRNRAYFGSTYGCFERCNEHKEDRKYASQICKCGKTQPIYNEPGEKTPICCVSCKTDTMIDVKNKKCNCGSGVIPYFNEPGEKTPICCVSCKTETMVNVKNKKCKCGSGVIPYFNEPSETKGICCASCKTETMVNVKSKKCKCGKTQPYYNEPGEKTPICCVSCKTDTMIDVKNKKCNCGSGVIPCFNEPGETKAVCCVSCKTDTMEDKRHKRCKSENCPVAANAKYKGYCANCFTHLFPNDPLTFQTRCKTKELAVRDYINMNFEGFICDRQLETGGCDCTIRRRPDLRILINETLLVIEIDENQHISYSEMDEETRYNDLYMAYSGKWIYIRFNPDKFKKNNKNVNPTISKRLPKLKDEIEKQFRRIENGENKELIERIYLYFDK